MKRYIIVCLSLMLLAGCQTYHMSRGDLLEQFANAKHEGKRPPSFFMQPGLIPVATTVVMFGFFPGVAEGTDLKEVKVYDKKGQPVIIPLTDHTGVKITKNDSSHVIFYFNTLEIKDSTITGSKTHFFEWRVTPIKLKDVARIEIQK